MSEPLISITRRHALIFASFLVLYEFLTYIANDMIMPGMINVVKSFHAQESSVATSLTMYILGGASLQVFLGPVSDAYGRRPMMLLGACLFFMFTLLIACSHSMDQFLVARFFQGMGLCFIGVIGYATIQEIFSEMDAIRLIAIMANAAILAPLLGPLLGAIVIHYASWRFIFIAIALCALFSLWGLWHFMPETIGQRKTDGKLISAVPLSAGSIYINYKLLLTNLTFCCSCIAIGLLGIQCMTWIALAPIIMITEAKLTVIQYGLWQLPIFGATILGNWALHRLTYKYKIKTIIYIGSFILIVGSGITALFPYLYGNDYHYLIPGTIVYFFSISIVNAPLTRYSLFVTAVGKGTASAITSLSLMVIGAIGIELASYFYQSHNNLYFGIYNTVVAVIYMCLISLTFIFGPTQEFEKEEIQTKLN